MRDRRESYLFSYISLCNRVTLLVKVLCRTETYVHSIYLIAAVLEVSNCALHESINFRDGEATY